MEESGRSETKLVHQQGKRVQERALSPGGEFGLLCLRG